MSELLHVILDHDTVKRNNKKMYMVGREMLQESGYVVYHTENRRSIQPTELHVPNPRENLHQTEEQHYRAHRSVSLFHLTEENVVEEADQVKYHMLSDEEQLQLASDRALRAVRNIQKSSEYDKDEKAALVAAVIEKDVLGQSVAATTKTRRDIAFVAHNHPQPAIGMLSIRDLLYPSEADVLSAVDIGGYNPGYVEAIVAADRKSTGMLLFGAAANEQQDPEGYAASVEYHRGARYNLGQLALRGYSHIVVELDDEGAVLDKYTDEITDFARSIKRPA